MGAYVLGFILLAYMAVRIACFVRSNPQICVCNTLRRHFFLIGMLVLVLLKLWLVQYQEVTAKGVAQHDDALFVRGAHHLVNGEWLGPYDNKTLVKGPGYPIWLAFVHLAGVPLLVAQQLLYAAACVLVVRALWPHRLRREFLLAIFFVLLFNPSTYSVQSWYVIRFTIYQSLTLMLVGGCIGMWVRRGYSLPRLAAWGALTGITFGAFWLTREEGIWILPVVVPILLMTGIAIWRERLPRIRSRLLLCATPVALLLLSTWTVSAVNYMYYGAFCVTDTKAPAFEAAVGALHRIEHEEWRRYVLFPAEARHRLYEVSPAFAELRPYLEGPLKGWAGKLPVQGKRIDDYVGTWIWALRDAIAMAGYDDSAAEFLGYCRRLAREVNEAANRGRIAAGPPHATQVPPWRREYLPHVLDSVRKTLFALVRYKGFSLGGGYSLGSQEQLSLFRDICDERIAPVKGEGLSVAGWRRPLWTWKAGVLSKLGWMYRVFTPLAAGGGAVCLVLAAMVGLLRWRVRWMWIVSLALLGAAGARLAMLAYIDVSLFPAVHLGYLAPAHPLLLLLPFLAMWSLCPCWVEGAEKRGSGAAPGTE
jgi:hypothetical protein